MMSEDFVVFCMGKLSESRYDGTYSKADIAAGLIKSYCYQWTKMCLTTARLHGVTSVVFIGSLVTNAVTRAAFEETFLAESLLLSMSGRDLIRMGVRCHASHLCALRVWNKKWKKEKERKKEATNA